MLRAVIFLLAYLWQDRRPIGLNTLFERFGYYVYIFFPFFVIYAVFTLLVYNSAFASCAILPLIRDRLQSLS